MIYLKLVQRDPRPAEILFGASANETASGKNELLCRVGDEDWVIETSDFKSWTKTLRTYIDVERDDRQGIYLPQNLSAESRQRIGVNVLRKAGLEGDVTLQISTIQVPQHTSIADELFERIERSLGVLDMGTTGRNVAIADASYHDVVVFVDGVDYRVFDQPFNYMLTCTRAGGWELFLSQRLVAGEYSGHEFKVVVKGVVVLHAQRKDPDVPPKHKFGSIYEPLKPIPVTELARELVSDEAWKAEGRDLHEACCAHVRSRGTYIGDGLPKNMPAGIEDSGLDKVLEYWTETLHWSEFNWFRDKHQKHFRVHGLKMHAPKQFDSLREEFLKEHGHETATPG